MPRHAKAQSSNGLLASGRPRVWRAVTKGSGTTYCSVSDYLDPTRYNSLRGNAPRSRNSLGEVTVLRNRKGKEWAVQFKPVQAENTMKSQLKAFLESHPEVGEGGETAEALLDMFKSAEEESNAAISAKESAVVRGKLSLSSDTISAMW